MNTEFLKLRIINGRKSSKDQFLYAKVQSILVPPHFVCSATVLFQSRTVLYLNICSVTLQRIHKLKFNRINWLLTQLESYLTDWSTALDASF